MSAFLMLWFSVTSVPSNFNVPSLGSVEMITALNALPSATSLNPKSVASSVRLPSSSIVIVLSAPLGASFTDVTLMVTVSLSLNGVPALSFDTMVNLSKAAPLRFAFGLYLRVCSAALICASVPLSVRVAESLVPALMVAPPIGKVTFNTPRSTDSVVLARLPSTSFTLKPVMAS